ncbi:MAG: hypothetical protein KDD61_16655 [Bdellovibrionales bacterium]|nr:hypothetical protein [Bdellovibrionales bacterium]
MIKDRNVQVIVIFFVILASTILFLKPSNEDLVTQNLQKLSKSLSFDETIEEKQRNQKISQFLELFSSKSLDIYIKPKFRTALTIEDTAALELKTESLLSLVRAFELSFHNLNVKIMDSGEKAQIKTDAKIRLNSTDPEILAPMTFGFIKSSGQWKIQKVSTPENSELEI